MSLGRYIPERLDKELEKAAKNHASDKSKMLRAAIWMLSEATYEEQHRCLVIGNDLIK